MDVVELSKQDCSDAGTYLWSFSGSDWNLRRQFFLSRDWAVYSELFAYCPLSVFLVLIIVFRVPVAIPLMPYASRLNIRWEVCPTSGISHSYRGYRWHRWYREYCAYSQPTPSMTPIPLYTYRQPTSHPCKEGSAELQTQDSNSKELESYSWVCITTANMTGAPRALSTSPKWKWPVRNRVIRSRVSWTSRQFSFRSLLFSFFLCAVPLPSHLYNASASHSNLFFQTTWAIYRLWYRDLINNWTTSWIQSYAGVPSPLPLFFASLYTLAIYSVLRWLGQEAVWIVECLKGLRQR